MAKKATKFEDSVETAEIISTEKQQEKGEVSDMINFLSETAKINPDVMGLIKTDENVLKAFYKTEHKKWIDAQSCSIALECDAHESDLSELATSWIKGNLSEISAYMAGNVGNKQSQTLSTNFTLSNGDRLEVVITGNRIKRLTPTEIQLPVNLTDSLSADLLTGAGVKKSVDMVTLRRRSVSLIKQDKQSKDDLFRYGAKVLIRKATKAEEKEDIEKA